MEQRNTRLRNAGFVTFFFSGICTISSGVVVSLLQDEYGFAYGMTGTLLSKGNNPATNNSKGKPLCTMKATNSPAAFLHGSRRRSSRHRCAG